MLQPEHGHLMRLLGAVLFVAGLLLTAVGAFRTAQLPDVRAEERVQTAEALSITAGWDLAVVFPEGNAAWAPGARLGPDRPLYPFVGRATLEATPVVQVEGGPASGVRGSLRYQAVLRTAKDGAPIWDRTVSAVESEFTVPGGVAQEEHRGRPLLVEMALWRRLLDQTNRSLELLDRYEADMLLVLEVKAAGEPAGIELSLASPVRLHPDGFSLPPLEARRQRKQLVQERRERVDVPYPLHERLLDQSLWFAVGAGGILGGALLLQRSRASTLDAEHRRYRSWIVGGRVSIGLDRQAVEVENLRALVTIAQDVGCRIVHDPRLGYVVADRGVCYVYRPSAGPRIGELLVGQGILTDDELAEAGALQAALRRPLGECLVTAGLADEAAVYSALAYQKGLVYIEPDITEPHYPRRLPVPAAVLGRRPDGRMVVAVTDPSVPPQLFTEVLGEPVYMVVTRPGALVGVHRQDDSDGQLPLGMVPLRVLREKGLTLGLLLRALGWMPNPELVTMDDRSVYRQAVREGSIHPDALHLAFTLVSKVREEGLPDLHCLLYHSLRLPKEDHDRLLRQSEEDLVDWFYTSRSTIDRAKRLLAAAKGCMTAAGISLGTPK